MTPGAADQKHSNTTTKKAIQLSGLLLTATLLAPLHAADLTDLRPKKRSRLCHS